MYVGPILKNHFYEKYCFACRTSCYFVNGTIPCHIVIFSGLGYQRIFPLIRIVTFEMILYGP